MQSERNAAPAAADERPAGAVSPLTSAGGGSYLKSEEGPRPRRADAPGVPPGAGRPAKPQGAGPMATSTESNPPAKDARGLSGLSESSLEQSILRRGLATPQEIDACKAHRAKLASASSNKDEPAKSLLDIMVEAKVITRNQSIRLVKEAGPEGIKKLEVPGYQILSKIGKGSMGIVYKAKQASVDRIVAVKVLLDALAKNKDNTIKRFERRGEDRGQARFHQHHQRDRRRSGRTGTTTS